MGVSRAEFLGMAAGVGGAVLLPATGAAAQTTRRGLTHRGVVYDVSEAENPAAAWTPTRMRRDVRAIRRDLHATSIKVTGHGIDRLTATATEAAERGLNVWLEPTLGDVPEQEILDHLAETGRAAERLRRQGAGVHLSVGCEFMLFVPGIVPGADILERIQNLLNGTFDPVHFGRALRRVTAEAAAVGRSVFHGPLTYGASADEDVDWNLFDIVGVNYFGFFPRPSGYLRDLRRYLRHGKPLAILEFGTCTFQGAPELGGMAWNVVDYSKEPPELNPGLIRSERTQARYLLDVLAAFETLDLYAAMAFTFISPDSTYHPEPRYDLDMASYGIVKPVRDRPGDPSSPWHWEPKEAFHALARAYGRDRR
jgi:hypothetical protein